MITLSLFVLVLIQSAIADLEDPFAESYPDGLSDPEGSEIERRGGDFLRFGRAGADRQANGGGEEEKKKSSGFIRFGRGGDRFLRFGRAQNDAAAALRDGEIYLRFGRSPIGVEKSGRPRRSANDPDEYPKRKDAFLRFGRRPEQSGSGHELHVPVDSPLAYLLAKVLASSRGTRWQNAQ